MELCIIIPAYNAHETIDVTLNSIKRQKINVSYEVVIVNDCSDSNYNSCVKKYKNFFNIREIKTSKNLGPGGARQYGIDNSNSKYIIFIDSDDCFYRNNSLSKMYEKIIQDKVDLVIGDFLCERDNKIIVKKHNFIWLHGKIYKRTFLNKNNISFNNTRANEDNGFNRLILLLKPNISYLDEIVYVYQENPESITRKNNRLYKLMGLEGYCYNMNWAMDEALKRGVNTKIIFMLTQNILGYLYFYYLDLEEKYDVSKILIWSKSIKKKYDKYKDLYKEVKINLIQIKNDLQDDITNINERISFLEFLKMIK